MSINEISFFILASAILLLGVPLVTSADEGHGEIVEFSYSGSKGPSNWGSLSPAYSTCSVGKKQSPVNIMQNQTVLNSNLQPLTRDYYPGNATLINHGYHIGLQYEENVGVLTLNGKNYTLNKLHWHSPAEHLINGIRHAAELHLVHTAMDGSISVVAILYQNGSADPFLAKIRKSLGELANETCKSHEEARIPLGTVDVRHLKRSTRKYYTYIGSLTTPPCTENVTWNILGKVRSISKEQIDALKSPLQLEYKNNARGVQPLNGRPIELYNEFIRN